MKKGLLMVTILSLSVFLLACAPMNSAMQPADMPMEQETTTTENDMTSKDDMAMKPEYQKITQEEAKARMDSGDPVIVLDVRTQSEYDGGHIPGALLLPNEEIGMERPEALPDLDAEILVYCRSGNRSRQASEKLLELGYTKVYDFGGINTWMYDTTTEP